MQIGILSLHYSPESLFLFSSCFCFSLCMFVRACSCRASTASQSQHKRTLQKDARPPCVGQSGTIHSSKPNLQEQAFRRTSKRPIASLQMKTRKCLPSFIAGVLTHTYLRIVLVEVLGILKNIMISINYRALLCPLHSHLFFFVASECSALYMI